MRDYIRRLLIAGIIALSMSILLHGGKVSNAQTTMFSGQTEYWVWPADGEITDIFGTREGMHKGIDIASDLETPIYSVDEGVVTKSYYSETYGHVIFIKHRNNFETVYAHLHKRMVDEGQDVHKGDIIGKMGNTGDSSGVHLHFEAHQEKWTYTKENAVNPDEAFGATEIGQAVFAQSRGNPESSIATAGHAHPEENSSNTDGAPVINTGQAVTHLVSTGETLWSIAQITHTSVEEIAELNNITDYKIISGQKLVIDQQTSKQYVVSKGDSLMAISRKTGVSINEIIKKNKLSSETIYPEQVLYIE